MDDIMVRLTGEDRLTFVPVVGPLLVNAWVWHSEASGLLWLRLGLWVDEGKTVLQVVQMVLSDSGVLCETATPTLLSLGQDVVLFCPPCHIQSALAVQCLSCSSSLSCTDFTITITTHRNSRRLARSENVLWIFEPLDEALKTMIAAR